jgi:glucan phosphoethanolaminetransferase (alkaline phosphatase superfamily)
MWQIIKAELSYNGPLLLAFYLVTLGIWIAYLFDAGGILQLFAVPAFFLMIALFTGATKEKRERFHALLPVCLEHRSLTGLLSYTVLFHATMLSAWTTQFLRERTALANEFITFWGVLTLNGLTIGIFFLLVIRLDLKHYTEKKYHWVADTAFVAALLLTFSIYFFAKFSAHHNPELYALIRNLVFYSPLVAVVTNVVCAGLLYLSMTVYVGRKSYLA